MSNKALYARHLSTWLRKIENVHQIPGTFVEQQQQKKYSVLNKLVVAQLAFGLHLV